MGVLDAGHQLGLGFEALDEAGVVGQLGPHDLDRHLPPHAGLHGPVDGPEGPLADDLRQLVAGDGFAGRRSERRVADRDAPLEIDQPVRRRQPCLLGQVVVVSAERP